MIWERKITSYKLRNLLMAKSSAGFLFYAPDFADEICNITIKSGTRRQHFHKGTANDSSMSVFTSRFKSSTV